MTENVSLPNGWHWGCGSITGGSHTHWFFTNLRFHYRGQLYTDPGQPWTVAFYEETGLTPDGDTKVCEYPTAQRQFDSEDDALDWIKTKARELLHDNLQ